MINCRKTTIYIFIFFLVFGYVIDVSASENGCLESSTSTSCYIEEPEYNVDFLFCKNQNCTEKISEFKPNESFFIDFEAEERLPMQAVISKEKKLVEIISIPGLFTFKEEGIYNIKFELLVRGYRELDLEKEIYVGIKPKVEEKIEKKIVNTSAVIIDDKNNLLYVLPIGVIILSSIIILLTRKR